MSNKEKSIRKSWKIGDIVDVSGILLDKHGKTNRKWYMGRIKDIMMKEDGSELLKVVYDTDKSQQIARFDSVIRPHKTIIKLKLPNKNKSKDKTKSSQNTKVNDMKVNDEKHDDDEDEIYRFVDDKPNESTVKYFVYSVLHVYT